MVGHGVGGRGLIVGALIGGLGALYGATALAQRLRLIAPRQRVATLLGGTIGFLLAALIAGLTRLPNPLLLLRRAVARPQRRGILACGAAPHAGCRWLRQLHRRPCPRLPVLQPSGGNLLRGAQPGLVQDDPRINCLRQTAAQGGGRHYMRCRLGLLLTTVAAGGCALAASITVERQLTPVPAAGCLPGALQSPTRVVAVGSPDSTGLEYPVRIRDSSVIERHVDVFVGVTAIHDSAETIHVRDQWFGSIDAYPPAERRERAAGG